MRNYLLVIVLSLFFIAYAAFGDEIPVKIKADTLQYQEDSSLVQAQGSVEARLQGLTIYADVLTMDPDTNIATAEGNVRIITNDYDAACSFVTYDITRETAAFNDFKSTTKGLYVSAKSLKELNTKLLGTWGSVSTCDDSSQHFYTTAQKAEIYQDDKVIGYNTVLYVGKIPVFWTPFMMYDLSKKRNTNWMFGHNQVEGDYLKSSWAYPLGLLYIDLMQNKGLGLGTKVDYGLAALGMGSAYLYHVKEQDTGSEDWVGKLSGQKQLNAETSANYDYRYSSMYLIPSGRSDQTALTLGLTSKGLARWNYKLDAFDDRMADTSRYAFSFGHAYNKMSTQYNWNYDFSKKDPKWVHGSQRLSFRSPLISDNIMLSTRFDYSNNIAGEGQVADQKLEPVIEITGKENGYSWKLTESLYVDLDGDTFTGDNAYQYLEKLPEIDVSLDAKDLHWFKLRPSFGYGTFREVRYVADLGRNRDFMTQRYKATLNADQTFALGLGTSLAVAAGIDQFAYGPGDQLYAYRESAGLHTNLGGFFRNDINYKKGLTDGNTPFLFDQLGTRYHNLDERMSFYYQNKFDWTTTGGFNWQSGKWLDVMSGFTFHPNNIFSWNIRSGWDIENRLYKDLVETMKLSPFSFFSMSLSSNQDLNNGTLKSGSILYDLAILKGQRNEWKFTIGQVYDANTRDFKVRDIMITRQLHCWDMRYTYSDYRKEFSFTFTLKAFPGEPVGYASGRGFHYDSIERQMKGLVPEGAVTRY